MMIDDTSVWAEGFHFDKITDESARHFCANITMSFLWPYHLPYSATVY